jgi:ankyrin repeat protein
MDMCRFTGQDDTEYKKVAAALHRMIGSISKQSGTAEFPPLSEEQRRTLLDSMRFDQIDARQMTIKKAHAKTCEWVLKMSEYLDWLDAAKLHEHHGFLWIKGKPGAGKSTMMKFALNNSRKAMKERIKISFFFSARGVDLEKSTIGMYRSLLVQLLERIPELQRVFESCEVSTWNSSRGHQWSVELLKDLFEQAIKMLGQSSVVCFIDALDECDEHEIRDMVRFFQQLGEEAFQAKIRFQVCFSSRHYPHVSISKGLSLVLEGQEGHNQDITSYINSCLKIGHSKLAEQIRVELQEKAKGVFMWVVLVVDILNKEHDGGRIHVLRRRLQDIPGDLYELFRDILMRDYNDRDELLLCIQWLLFAKRPLTPEELYFAIISGSTPQDLSQWHPNEITADTIKRFITTSSKGLAEITKSKTPMVQFIHESVRDFLLKGDGLSAVWPNLESNFQGQSHQQLKQRCLNYMSIDIATHLKIENPLPKAWSQEATDLRQSAADAFPFLEYAVQNIFFHADAAEREGVSQKDFLQIFPLTDWINVDNLFERHEIRRYTPNASLLYILAEHNMANLIKAHPPNLSCFKMEDERYGMPIFAALATGSEEAVEAIVKFQAEVQLPTSSLYNLCKKHYQDGKNLPKITRDFTFSGNKILHSAIEHGDEKLLAFLLATDQFEVNSKNSMGRTALSSAVERGNVAVVKVLLTTNVDLDANDKEGQTPLWFAARNGHEAVVKLLLATGQVDVNAKNKNGQTPLSCATQSGHEAIVKLLLATGRVEADTKDNWGETPLLRAAQNGHEAVVKLLLATGRVEADTKDNWGETPLLTAVRNGHEAVVKLLLATGQVEVNTKNNNSQTPLSCAAQNGHEAVVKLLLAAGRVEADTKDNWGETPLLTAVRNGHEAVVKLLLATGQVDVNAKNKNGQTPLSYAAHSGHEAIVKLLLATGQVDVNEKDFWDKTPLTYATENGHKAVVKLLLAAGAGRG